jgi:predicted HicB family RNase H-like nuclease
MTRWEQQTQRRKRQHYAVQVSAELHARVRAEAERRGISMTRLVDAAISATLPEVPAP